MILLSKDFLLEIGSEEIPAGYLKDASSFLESSFRAFITESRLQAEIVRTTYTPRRLTLLASGLQARQTDLDIIKTGPAKRVSFQPDGTPSAALNGFLRSNQASPADVFWQDNGKGEVACLRISQPGQDTDKLLPGWITAVIGSVPFPKKMRWGWGGLDFARPLRWLVCLWGNEILPVQLNGLTAGRSSFGNRYPGLNTTVDISDPSAYFDALRSVQVIADREQRYGLIRRQLEDFYTSGEYRVDLDEGLLQTVTDLVEYPAAVEARFEDKFLALPDRIITSTISTNQKYFAVRDASGSLTDRFLFISNGDPRFSDLIRRGNEKVVKPRLEDAMWYFQEDTKQPLESYVPHLESVVFQADLGTLKAKTERVVEIASHIARQLCLSDREKALAERTALLCKADLVTKMLCEKEFTKLQGYIGMHYALASGEPQEVARGVYEHYLPRGQNDELPSSLTGSIVAVADKLDTVCGIIGIGMLPTGSADPFALRRAANGVVQIIAEGKWDLDLTDLIHYTLECFRRLEVSSEANRETILGYFHQRINWYLSQLQIDYDVVDSVMHIDFGNLLHLIERARALQQYKAQDGFVRLVIGFKRVSNIIKDEKQQLKISEKLLAEPAEKALHSVLLRLEKDIETELGKLHYTEVLNHLVGIRAAIDKFFDDVLVNTEDEQLRQNRYALLQQVRRAFLKVADLSLLVVEGKSAP